MFPCLSRATSITPSRKACYVPFTPRNGKLPSRMFIVDTPDARTRKNITKHELHLACSSSGLPQVQRRNRNVLTVSFPTVEEAASVQHSVSITLPSNSGESVDVKADYHGPYPSRTFSCDVKDLDIDHATVAANVMKALRGSATGLRAPFTLLQQETSNPRDRRKRYLIKFDFGLRPPCTPWLQCFYIPLDHIDSNKRMKVWGVFKPEDVVRPCSFCGERCQRGPTNFCPFTEVIGNQVDSSA